MIITRNNSKPIKNSWENKLIAPKNIDTKLNKKKLPSLEIAFIMVKMEIINNEKQIQWKLNVIAEGCWKKTG
jgi:hypothetical protein